MTTTTIETTTELTTKSKNEEMFAEKYYPRGGKQKVAHIELPQEVTDNFASLTASNLKNLRNDYIVALVTEGWTQVSIAKSSKLSKQMIQIILKTHTALLTPPTLVIPPVPKHAPNLSSVVRHMPSPELLERLKELQPLATKVRANSPRYRAEAEEYTRLLNKAVTEEGVTLYRLGKLLGVTHGALVFRLVRYGYKTSTGTSAVYSKVKESNRKG